MIDYFIKKTAGQFRKPTGLFGKIILRYMQKRNEPIYSKFISIVNIQDGDKILEIGYGAGLTIKGLLDKYNNCHIDGIDFSKEMYNKAVKNNREYIEQGKAKLSFGEFLSYNKPENEYELIFAINVIYFWNDLSCVFQKINSLLKTGGRVILYMSADEQMKKFKFAHDEVFNKYSVEYVLEEFRKAGFSSADYNLNEGFQRKAYFVTAVK